MKDPIKVVLKAILSILDIHTEKEILDKIKTI